MKKFWPLIVILLLLSACKGEHVYHTYYGDIDTDTMVTVYANHVACYLVYQNKVNDSVASAMMLDSIIQKVYYVPSENKYFLIWYGSDGGRSARIYFDPYTEDVLK